MFRPANDAVSATVPVASVVAVPAAVPSIVNEIAAFSTGVLSVVVRTAVSADVPPYPAGDVVEVRHAPFLAGEWIDVRARHAVAGGVAMRRHLRGRERDRGGARHAVHQPGDVLAGLEIAEDEIGLLIAIEVACSLEAPIG